MVEPKRKKAKAHAKPVARATVVDEASNGLTFITTHATNPFYFDLRLFATGADGPSDGRNATTWGGNFAGRPHLIQELAPQIRSAYGSAPLDTGRWVMNSLKAMWRLLDKCDTLPDVEPVRSVRDLHGVHEAMLIREGIPHGHALVIRRLADMARQELGLADLYWSIPKRVNGTLGELLEREQVRALYNVLKDRVRAIYAAWAANETLVPCSADVKSIFVFLTLKTGWNEAVVLNIDVDDCIRPHPTDPDRHIVYSSKSRAEGREQHYTGRDKEQWTPGNLIRELKRRTEPLRRSLRSELEGLEPLRRERTLTKAQTLRMAALRRAIRSPWLWAFKVSRTSTEDYSEGAHGWRTLLLEGRHLKSHTTATGTSYVRELLDAANARLGPAMQIEKLTLSDLRDAFIGWAYESSGYQWLMAKLAGGHASVESAITYLRKRRFKAHGESQIRKLGNALFDEITTHRQVDPAILYALVQRGAITDVQRKRWEAGKDRTRVGTGCLDFKHPPKRVAPDHIEGQGCRNQRCVLCEHAIVFSDSVDHLARRKAELGWARTQIPVAVWFASDFDDEVRRLDQTLDSFEVALVEPRVSWWSAQIEAGRHRPILFEGAYA